MDMESIADMTSSSMGGDVDGMPEVSSNIPDQDGMPEVDSSAPSKQFDWQALTKNMGSNMQQPNQPSNNNTYNAIFGNKSSSNSLPQSKPAQSLPLPQVQPVQMNMAPIQNQTPMMPMQTPPAPIRMQQPPMLYNAQAMSDIRTKEQIKSARIELDNLLQRVYDNVRRK